MAFINIQFKAMGFHNPVVEPEKSGPNLMLTSKYPHILMTGLWLQACDVKPSFILPIHAHTSTSLQYMHVSSHRECPLMIVLAQTCVYLSVCVCVCRGVACATNCPFRWLACLLEAPKWHGWPLAGRLLAHQDIAHKEEPPLMEAKREGWFNGGVEVISSYSPLRSPSHLVALAERRPLHGGHGGRRRSVSPH